VRFGFLSIFFYANQLVIAFKTEKQQSMTDVCYIWIIRFVFLLDRCQTRNYLS